VCAHVCSCQFSNPNYRSKHHLSNHLNVGVGGQRESIITASGNQPTFSRPVGWRNSATLSSKVRVGVGVIS
jgi:hypothetical protein